MVRISAADFWKQYYKDDPNFPVSEAACEFAEAYLVEIARRAGGEVTFMMPEHLNDRINEWLSANSKLPSEVEYAYFPIGMVNRWIERTIEAEKLLRGASQGNSEEAAFRSAMAKPAEVWCKCPYAEDQSVEFHIAGIAGCSQCKTCNDIRETHKGFGPSHNGSTMCKSGSIASGGKNSHCTCDMCF